MRKGATTSLAELRARNRDVAGRFLELLGAMKRYVRELLPPLEGGGMSEEQVPDPGHAALLRERLPEDSCDA